MKKILLFCTVLMTALAGCKKDDNSSEPTYHIDGITDLRYFKTGSLGSMPFLELRVQYDNAPQERVSLSVEGLPVGLKDTIITKVGIPSFTSFVGFTDNGVAEGTYALKLVAQGELTGRREYTFNFEVAGPPDCTSGVLGNMYFANSSCTGSNYQAAISAQGSIKNRILINNVDGNGAQIYADLDCVNQQVFIPSQVVGGNTYAGNGSFGTFSGGKFMQLNLSINFSTCFVSLVM